VDSRFCAVTTISPKESSPASLGAASALGTQASGAAPMASANTIDVELCRGIIPPLVMFPGGTLSNSN
jgi:hypothetical protein